MHQRATWCVVPVQFILDDLGVTAPGQFVAFVKAVPGEIDALALLFVESVVHLSLHHSELEVAVQIFPEGYVDRRLTARGRGWQ